VTFNFPQGDSMLRHWPRPCDLLALSIYKDELNLLTKTPLFRLQLMIRRVYIPVRTLSDTSLFKSLIRSRSMRDPECFRRPLWGLCDQGRLRWFVLLIF